ncbi:hypothetical protein D9M71_728670 [compost metagenome]
MEVTQKPEWALVAEFRVPFVFRNVIDRVAFDGHPCAGLDGARRAIGLGHTTLLLLGIDSDNCFYMDKAVSAYRRLPSLDFQIRLRSINLR